MISAVCAVALAFSPSLSLQSRSMAAQSSRVATSDISMINLFGNNGERVGKEMRGNSQLLSFFISIAIRAARLGSEGY